MLEKGIRSKHRRARIASCFGKVTAKSAAEMCLTSKSNVYRVWEAENNPDAVLRKWAEDTSDRKKAAVETCLGKTKAKEVADKHNISVSTVHRIWRSKRDKTN